MEPSIKTKVQIKVVLIKKNSYFDIEKEDKTKIRKFDFRTKKFKI